MSNVGPNRREFLCDTCGMVAYDSMGGVYTCAVCGGNRGICHHDTDEWYDALLAETQRHVTVIQNAYSTLFKWAGKVRRERGAMKRRVRELEAQLAHAQRRIVALQDEYLKDDVS